MYLYIQPDNSVLEVTSSTVIPREVQVGTIRVEKETYYCQVCTAKRFHDRTGYRLQWAFTNDPVDMARVDTILLLLE